MSSPFPSLKFYRQSPFPTRRVAPLALLVYPAEAHLGTMAIRECTAFQSQMSQGTWRQGVVTIIITRQI